MYTNPLNHKEVMAFSPRELASGYPTGEPYPSTPNGRAYPQQHSLKEQFEMLLDVIVRRKWLILSIFTLVVGAVSLYVFYLMPDQLYQASSLVRVDLNSTAFSPQGIRLNEVNRPPQQILDDEVFFLQVSSTLPQRVSEQITQAGISCEGMDAGNTLLCGKGGKPLEAASLAQRLRAYVTFTKERAASDVIRITASSPDAQEAANLANLYALQYVQLKRETNRTGLNQSRDYLEEQAEKHRQELMAIEGRMGASQSVGSPGGLDLGASQLASQLAVAEAERDRLTVELQMYDNRLQSLRQKSADLNPQLVQLVSSDPTKRLDDLRLRLQGVTREKEETIKTYPGPSREPAVEAKLNQLDAEIQTIQQQIEQIYQERVETLRNNGAPGGEEALRYAAALRQDIDEAESEKRSAEMQLRMAERRVSELQGKMAGIPSRSAELAQLERARSYSEQMYQFFLEQAVQVRVSGEIGGGVGRASVIREAYAPLFLSAWGRYQFILLAIFGGFFLAMGLALIRDRLDNRLFKAEQLRDSGYRVIGTVPNMMPLIRHEYKNKPRIEHNGKQVSTSLVAQLQPVSAVAEGYRQLRAAIHFGSPLSERDQVLIITSASMGEGKSVTASNLAVVMAQAGLRTLLIDADLRRPRVHTLFGVALEPGLVGHLLGNHDRSTIVSRTDIENLHIITAGGFSVHSSELLVSSRMHELISHARAEYDIILIDTPPVRATTDAAVLSSLADATVLVTRAGKTREAELRYAVDTLASVGANNVGIVFNGFDVSMAYGYTYRYGDYSVYSQYSRKGYYTTSMKEAGEQA